MYKKFLITILMILTSFSIIIINFYPLFGSNDSHLPNDLQLTDSKEIVTHISRTLPRSSIHVCNDWPMYLHDSVHNSYTFATGPTNGTILWYNTTGDTTYSSPCVANGRVFIGVGDTMKCYYENNGTLNWSMSTIQKVAGTFGVCSSPAYANGCIYFGADRIYCVWATNGTIRWKVDKPNIKHGDGTPTLAYGKVFIAGSDYKLYCIDQLNGSVLWTFQAKSDYPPAIPDNWGLYAAPAVVNGSVYLSACDWHLYQINITQPTSVATANHTFKMGYASYSSPLVVNDRVYVGCSYIDTNTVSRFYCLYSSNLTKIWEYYPGSATGFFSSAGYYNGDIYVGSIDGNLYCLNATSGTEVWKYDIGGTWSSPAITNERLYIGSKSGYIYCFNITQPSTPEFYWRHEITGEVDCSPAVVPGRVYIGTHGEGGRIYCFGTSDTIPPQIITTNPANGASEVPITAEITATFNEPINPTTLTTSSFSVVDGSSNSISGKISYDSITRTATFNPDTNLKPNEVYTVIITTGVQDNWANELDGNMNNIQDGSPADDYSWTFSTSMNKPPTLTNAIISPKWGNLDTEFKYSIDYTDLDNDSSLIAPAYIRIYLDGELTGSAMILDSTAPPNLRDSDFSNGERFVYSTKFTTYGDHTFQVKCSDGTDTNSTQVYYNPLVWHLQELYGIPNQQAVEDIDLVLDLNNKINDEDTNKDELVLSENSSYATVDDFIITFNYPNSFNYPSGRNYEIVNISLYDPTMDYNVSQDIQVMVTPVNDPPQISGLIDRQINENEELIINVSEFINDEDNEISDLEISTNSSYATVIGHEIIFYYPFDSGIIKESVRIVVSDGYLDGHQNITVTVIPEGAPFILLPIPNQNATEDIDLIVNMVDYIEPLGNQLDEFNIEINSSHGAVEGIKLVFNYPNSFNYPSGRSYEFVQVRVSFENYSDSETFTIYILPVNDAPILTILKTPTMTLENSTIQFKVEHLDVDGSENPLVELIIDENPFKLIHVSGDIHVEGSTYELGLKLPAGDYQYCYRTNDMQNTPNSIFTTEEYFLTVLEFSETGNDSDGDSIPDGWELKFGLDPYDPADAGLDPDNDNYTNLQEYLGSDGKPGGNDFSDPVDIMDTPDQDTPDDDGENEEGGKGDKKTDFIWLGTILMVIILVLFLIIFYFLKYKKGNREEPEDFEPGVIRESYPTQTLEIEEDKSMSEKE